MEWAPKRNKCECFYNFANTSWPTKKFLLKKVSLEIILKFLKPRSSRWLLSLKKLILDPPLHISAKKKEQIIGCDAEDDSLLVQSILLCQHFPFPRPIMDFLNNFVCQQFANSGAINNYNQNWCPLNPESRCKHSACSVFVISKHGN